MKELKVTDFVNKLASNDPTPGGGAAAGVTASLGIAAILMAMRFSTNKKMSDEERAFLKDTIDQYDQSKDHFIELIDRDASDFEPLSQAYGLPKETDEEKEKRKAAIQEGLKTASQPPVELLEEVEAVCQDLEKVVPLIKKSIISDLGVGVQMLRSAIYSSSLNLNINAGQLKDPDLSQDYRQLATDKVDQLAQTLDTIYQQVQAILAD